MSVLNPTPRAALTDPQGRPYFLWDMDMTLVEFERLLGTGDRPTRAYLMGKLLRQAKPDDALTLVKPEQIRELWPDVERYLGRSRDMWRWLLDVWGV